METSTTYTGSCHCGQITFTFEAEITQALSCNCSLCRRRGSLLSFVPRGALTLRTPASDAAAPDAAARDAAAPDAVYRFHTHQIAHHFCPTCGIHTHGEGTAPNGTAMAAINLRCVDQIDLDTLPLHRFDGRAL